MSGSCDEVAVPIPFKLLSVIGYPFLLFVQFVAKCPNPHTTNIQYDPINLSTPWVALPAPKWQASLALCRQLAFRHSSYLFSTCLLFLWLPSWLLQFSFCLLNPKLNYCFVWFHYTPAKFRPISHFKFPLPICYLGPKAGRRQVRI